MRNRIFFLLLIAIFYSTIVRADNWFIGAGSGLQMMNREGHFTQSNGTASLFSTPHAAALNVLGNVVGGYEWMMTPQFFLATELIGEVTPAISTSTVNENNNGDTLSIKTTQRDVGGYGFLIQPGVYSRKFNTRIFFDIGMMRSQFDTRYYVNMTSSGNNFVNNTNNTRWSNGVRWGMSVELPMNNWPNVFNRFDWTMTHYPAWNIRDSANTLITTERPVVMQITWNLVWQIDAGQHLVSDTVLHHGLLHYAFHPDDFGNESKDINASPF